MNAPSACPACGAGTASDARFCARCGTELAATGRAQEARKVVSALFADIVGSTALGERLDPEDLKTVVDGALAEMVAVIEELGGGVEDLRGDGVLALFGAPVAHEDDPERAVIAGLRIVERIEEHSPSLRERWGLEALAVRVGVETGLAALGPVGVSRRLEFGAIGDVLNTAARLQGEAAPGTVLVGERTRRLVEPLFEWGERRALTLKGKSEQVSATPVLRRRHGAGAIRGVPGVRAELVGRDRELRTGLDATDEVLTGAGGVLLVTGEAGIGKTRLLSELRARYLERRSAGGPPIWLESRCSSYGASLPYHPFRLLLRAWLGVEPEGADVEVTATLEERSGEFGGRTAETRALLAALLGLPPGEGDAAGLEALSPGDRLERTAAALRAGLQRLSADRPVVISIDDVHWADPSSAALVEHLLAVSDAAAVLFVLAGRPERAGPTRRIADAALREVAHRTRQLDLAPLHRDADRALLARLVGAGTLPAELEATVLERAEGNPFFLEEIVRSLLDSGALVRAGGVVEFRAGADVEIPESIERLVLARADQLSSRAQEALRAAAVLGRRFGLPLLEAIDDRDGLGEALQELRRSELLRESGRWPEPEYAFKHSLIQEAVYRSLLKRRRQELHARAAQALEQRGPGGAEQQWLALLAHHFSAADEHEPAMEYHARAGESARRIYAHREAAEHFDLAIAAARALDLADDDPKLLRLHHRHAETLTILGAVSDAVEEVEAALATARRAGERRLEMEFLSYLGTLRHTGYERARGHHEQALAIAESLGDTAAQVQNLSRLSILASNELRLDSALDLGGRALSAAEAAADERLRGLALDALKLAALLLGDLETLERISERLIEMHRRDGDLFYLSWALLESAFAPLARGDFEPAQARLSDALEVNQRLGDRTNRPLFLHAMCWLHRSRGEHDRAMEVGLEGAALAQAVGNPEWIAWTEEALGWTLLETRAPADAAERLERGLAAARRRGAVGAVIRCAGLLAWARGLLGEREAAREMAERTEELLGGVTAPQGGAFLFGAHGALGASRAWLELDEPARARALCEPLLAAAERSGWVETATEARAILAEASAAAR